MDTKDYFIGLLKREVPVFEKVMNAAGALPQKTLETYRPDPKSRTAFELMSQTFGMESVCFPIMLEKGELDWSKLEKPNWKSAHEIVDVFKKNMDKTEKMVKKMSNEDWNSKMTMLMDGKVVSETTKGEGVLSFLLDLIHHRGQLAVYLRPMGGKVPQIYGPSADNPEM